MTTLDYLNAAYHDAAQRLHEAAMNGLVDDAHLWAGTLNQVARQIECLPVNLESNQD